MILIVAQSLSSRRVWAWLHTWSSVVCTAFLLLLCLTGLPLVFAEDIQHWREAPLPQLAMPAGAVPASVDAMVVEARRHYPRHVVTSVVIEDEQPRVIVYMAPSWEAVTQDPRTRHAVTFDARNGAWLDDERSPRERGYDFMEAMLAVHTELFAGWFGELLLGVMGVLFVVALASGVALYGPSMKKQAFGTVRHDRSPRVRWLDLHNLLGISVLAWTLVVGATGILNELATPLFTLWEQTDVRAILAPYHGQAPAQPDTLASVAAALGSAEKAAPGMRAVSVVYPGDPEGSPYHYVVWTQGRSKLASRLFSPVLVDARSGALNGIVAMPWYLRALEVSRPFHFGDYGGLPLKLFWAAFDLTTIFVLSSGLYLWCFRRRG